MEDILCQLLLGRSREEFLRDANLMRSAEGLSGELRCPVCKKPIRTNEKGDQFCSNFSLDYKKDGKCYWHRYKDGLNYWSSMTDIIKAKMKENEELKRAFEGLIK